MKCHFLIKINHQVLVLSLLVGQFLSSFLPNLRWLLIPTYNLQKKAKKFKWTDKAEKAFNGIKELLVNPPVLKVPTHDGLFWLESDTSQEGVGGTLLQKQGHIRSFKWFSPFQLVFLGDLPDFFHSQRLTPSQLTIMNIITCC